MRPALNTIERLPGGGALSFASQCRQRKPDAMVAPDGSATGR